LMRGKGKDTREIVALQKREIIEYMCESRSVQVSARACERLR
jgi:hypothetical protein